MIKKYFQFITENTIKLNPAIPTDYIESVEKEEDMTTSGYENSKRLHELFILQKAITRGKEQELEDLATEIITTLNSQLLEILKVKLDIKLVSENGIKRELSDCKGKLEKFKLPKIVPKIGDDDQVKAEIAKRDLANLIIQGEAKQIKDILLKNEITKDIVASRIQEIFGEDSERIMDVWVEMLDIHNVRDRNMDTESMGMTISELPEGGLLGFTYVDWEVVEGQDDEKSTTDEDEDEDEDEYSPFTGEESEEDFFDMGSEEDITESPEDLVKVPKITAVGLDFPMLLHEAQKGIYEFLAVPGLPKDEKTLASVLYNTGSKWEPEGWKYGPKASQHLMEFFRRRVMYRQEKNEAEGNSDENERIQEMVNLRQLFFRELLKTDTIPTLEFLRLMKGIFLKMMNKPDYSKEEEGLIEFANIKSDKIIGNLISKLDYEYKKSKYEKEMEEYNRKVKEYEKQLKQWEESQKKPLTPDTKVTKVLTDQEKLQELESKLRKAEIEEEYELAAKLKREIDELRKKI